MHYIDIDKLCRELEALMENNFRGNPKDRFEKAKKLILQNMEDIIAENREEILKNKEVEN